MRRKLKSWEVMRVIFPEVLADYFEIVDVTESDTSIDIFMDEREFMEREDYKMGTVRSYGFTEEKVIQDFPIRGKASYLHVRRRKWRDSSTGEIFSYSYDDLTVEGSKLSPEILKLQWNQNNYKYILFFARFALPLTFGRRYFRL